MIRRGELGSRSAAASANGRERSAERLRVLELIEAVQRLSLARSLPELQAIVRRAARALTGADGATFILRDGDHCFYADEDAIAPLWKGQRFPMTSCVSGWAMLNKQAAVIPDIYTDDRVPHEAYRPTFVKSMAMVPIRKLQPIGAVGNYWARHHLPSDQELELLQALADATAVALENVQAQSELVRRAHATAAFTFVSDGVILVDRDGTVVIWNPAAERITGLSEAELVGSRLAEVMPGWAEIGDRIPVAEADADRTAREALPLRIGDRELWLSISGTSFEGGTVYAFRDVTAERALDQLRSNLIATVSHELRTPLAAVYGAATTLRRPDVPAGTPARNALLEIIETQSARLAAIVEEMLLASRLESGVVTPTFAEHDAAEIAREVVDAMHSAYPHAPISVATTGDTVAILDAEKVGQVLRNLVENAIRYSPGGAPIDVRLDGLRFSVADHGIGIAEDERDRIFEKFYRVDSSLSRDVRGTGLGLYICRELVERMGGTITVESEPGRGSTFSFTLPQRPQ